MPARRWVLALAPVGQPSVVGPDARQSQLVVFGNRRTGHDRAGREERRDGVGKDHLGDDAVCFELGDSAVVVPVAVPGASAEVFERVRVLRPPGVELCVVARLEIGPVLLVIASGVAVRRNEYEVGRSRRGSWQERLRSVPDVVDVVVVQPMVRG